MNACSYSILTLLLDAVADAAGRPMAVSGPPARLSSQFGPQSTVMPAPVSCECAVATGSCS